MDNTILQIQKQINKQTKKTDGFNVYNHKFIIVAISLLFLLLAGVSVKKFKFNQGIDFAGGIVIESTCNNCDVQKITKTVEKKLNIIVQHQQIDNGYLFKTTSTNNYDKIISEFNEILSQNNAKIISTDFVSPQMTKSFIEDGIIACLFAFVCIGLYIIIRFNWRFAIATICALIYDVLMVIGFISITHIEVCLITLTALLTIIGYCVNDKIVIFDKIRENLDEKSKSISDIIKESARSVLIRSVLTSFTTCIATISLLFFGDRLIYELGMTIIFGVIIGTISSLLLAPSLLLILKVKHIIHVNATKDPMWYAS